MIENRVSQAKHFTTVASRELAQADRRQKQARNRKCMIVSMGVIILVAVLIYFTGTSIFVTDA